MPGKPVMTRWGDDELAELDRRADAAGLTRTAYIKARTIGDDGTSGVRVPRRPRPAAGGSKKDRAVAGFLKGSK